MSVLVTIVFQPLALKGREMCRAIEGLQPTGENVNTYLRAVAGDTQMHREVVEAGNCT